jgi:hypothetical protein
VWYCQNDRLDCDYSRLDNSSGVLRQLDEATVISELEAQSDNVLQEWSSLLGIHGKDHG